MDALIKHLEEHIATVNGLIPMLPQVEALGETLYQCLEQGGTLFFMGNGGSAADSQHLAAEFIGRFEGDRHPLPAIALSTDTSILTAVGNDYGFDAVFERGIRALAKSGDVVIGISTSGNSPNVMRGIEAATRRGCTTVGLLGGNGGKLKEMVDVPLIVPSQRTARIQECHILIGHILCDLVNRRYM